MSVDSANAPLAQSSIEALRATNGIRKLHHHAFMVKDMEQTRHFYEDVLGMPLIGTWVERTNPVTGQPDNYVHTFFELCDGSCLAFFQFKSPASSLEQSVNEFANINPFSHHIALEVSGRETLLAYKQRLTAAGVEAVETDHGYCYSIYFHDPNGLQLELTTAVAETERLMLEAGADAHDTLKKWLMEAELPTNNTRRGAGWVRD